MNEKVAFANDPSRTQRAALVASDVHQFARERLAGAMVPARVVVVDELPKLPNGKIDRTKLLDAAAARIEPDAPSGRDDVASPDEAAACALWAGLLGWDWVDADADFFELGGTSLTAVQMAARWTAAGGAPFDLATFMEHPTPRHMVSLSAGHRLAPGTGRAYSWLTSTDELTSIAILPPDIRPSGTPRPIESRFRNVLLTALAGAVGPAIAREFLERSDTTVHVLVPSLADGEALTSTPGLSRHAEAKRIVAVPGDLAKPYLGLDPATYRRLVRDIDLIVHTGECFDQRSPWELLVQTNVLGTQEVLRFAAAERIKPVHFLSILSTAAEDESAIPARNHPLPATDVIGALRQSKWVGEQYVQQASQRGIPGRVYRIGQIITAREQLVELGDDFLAAMIRTCVALRMAPRIDLSFAVTPTSLVGRVLVDSALTGAYDADPIDIVAGPPVSWQEIMSNVRASGRALTVTSYEQWRRALLETVDRGEIHALTPFMPLVGPDGLSRALGYLAAARRGDPSEPNAPDPEHESVRELLRTYPSRFGNISNRSSIVVREHTITVPVDRSDPHGPSIEIYAQEVVSADRQHDDLPWMLFLQGGPGAGCPTPTAAGGWLATALKGHRVMLLDERGGGRSAPITARSMEGRSADEMVAYLRHFRADSIVADAEDLRQQIAGGRRWSLVGQSYGGFVALTYLSLAPEALDAAFVSGGIPGLSASIDDVYDFTYSELVRKNADYYAEYPEDVQLIRRLARHLDDNDVTLPNGDRFTGRHLRLLGRNLGMSNGPERIHRLFSLAWDGDEISEAFLRAALAETGYTNMQLYSLHEFIYAAPGRPTQWAAHRALSRFPAFHDPDGPLLLFGEMIFPWMFQELDQLKPFADVADRLAASTDLPDLYDLDRLAANTVPLVAVLYAGDLYTPVELQRRTIAMIGNAQILETDEFHHNGLIRNGLLLARLLDLAKDAAAD